MSVHEFSNDNSSNNNKIVECELSESSGIFLICFLFITTMESMRINFFFYLTN